MAKVDLVATWAEANIYSARERAALAWRETPTTMATRSVGDAGFDDLLLHFTMQEVAHLTAAVGQITAWNRIAGGLRFAPPIPVGHFPEQAGTGSSQKTENKAS